MQSWMMVMVMQLCNYTKNHWIVHLMGELYFKYFNEAVPKGGEEQMKWLDGDKQWLSLKARTETDWK